MVEFYIIVESVVEGEEAEAASLPRSSASPHQRTDPRKQASARPRLALIFHVT
jgi:hypothetical protein